jgi:hypothetical protein
MRHWSAAGMLMLAGWLGSQSVPQPTALEALTQAETRWQQRKPSVYEFAIEVRCFCIGLLQTPVSFEVRGTEVRPLQDLKPDARWTYGHYETIEKLFNVIRGALTRGQYKVAIEYDPELGYPVWADVDPQKNTADDELSFKVSGFRKTDFPDFSGRWSLVRPETAGAEVARTLTVRQPIVRTNVYGAPMAPAFLQITIERQLAATSQTDTYTIGSRSGSVSGVPPGASVRSSSTLVRWEDKRLVIDTTISVGGTSAERTEVWQLDPDGTLTVSVTQRSSGTEPSTTTATYRRD